MRRLKLPLAMGAVVVAAAVGTACTNPPTTATLASAPSASPDSLFAYDPWLTQQACTAAALTTADSARLFRNQMALIEKAAAEDNPSALVAAASVVQRSFVDLAEGLAFLARKPVSPQVAAALSDVSASFAEISSNTYVGSTSDISTRLSQLTAAVVRACV